MLENIDSSVVCPSLFGIICICRLFFAFVHTYELVNIHTVGNGIVGNLFYPANCQRIVIVFLSVGIGSSYELEDMSRSFL